jgi:DNA-directed DNA polymerase III PolC
MKFLEQFEKIDLPLHGVRLPTFIVEDEYRQEVGIEGEVDNYAFLRRLCDNGLKDMGLGGQDYAKRIDYELGIIKELGFVDYILLVWDVIYYCRRNSIPTGYGRGSAAGSLVLYVIGVTKVDPLKYNLYFERFISRIRAKKQVVDGITYLDGSLMCDVDIDICYYNRHKVLDYLDKKFAGRICKILTTTTLTGKLLIKECGKIVGGKTDEQMGQISDLVPTLHGKVYDIQDAYHGIRDKNEPDKWKLEPVKAFVDWCNTNKEVYQIALKLRDLIKNKGVHASALCISFDPLLDSMPTEFDSDKNEVTSYSMDWVALTSVKLDALGLRGASVVDDVCKSIGIKMSDINFEDVTIYQNLQDLKTPHGIFQIEADTNFNVLRKVKPKNLEELSAVLALARPGALAYVDQFASFTNFDSYEAIHPFFDSILKPTGGVAIYQEQLMQMAHKVGFTLDEAEILRRIVGKKKLEEVKAWQARIENKIKENNLDPKIAELLWKILEDSASYSFNKSHSLAYACLSAATIYLKFKYPQQFFLSLLKMSRNEVKPVEEISKIHKEMAAFNIQLLRPHLTISQLDFTIEGPDIRFGLLSIKGISDKSIEKLNQFRTEYSTKFEVFEGASHAGLNIGVLCALIQAGTFEGFKQSRSKVVYEAQVWNKLTGKGEKAAAMALGPSFDYDLVAIILELTKRTDDKGKPIIKASRLDTIRRHCEKYKQIYELNSKSENFANWYYEKKLLGFTHNKTLKDIFLSKCPDLDNIKEVLNLPDNNEAYFVASVDSNAATRTSKNGNKYMSFDCSDETGVVNVKIFDTKRRDGNRTPLQTCLSLNNDETPKTDNIVIVKGKKKEGGCIFGDIYAIQTNKIYTKLSELKSDRLDKASKN